MKIDTRHIICFVIFFMGIGHKSISQWQFLGSPETGTPVNFDAEGDTVLVCSRSDLFYSSDNAQSWVEIPTPDSAVFLNKVLVENGHLFLVASNGENSNNSYFLYRSEDMGKTWKSIGNSFTKYYYNILTDKENLVLGLYPDSIAISHNAGESYKLHGWSYDHTLILHNNILISLDSNEIVYSNDFGFTWDSTVFDIVDFQAIELTSIEGVLWRTDVHVEMRDTRFSRSFDNGETWETVLIHHYFAEAPSLKIVGQGENLYIASKYSNGILLVSDDNGKTWLEKNVPNEGYDVFYSNGLLFVHSHKGILLSRDNGDSFHYSNRGFNAAEVKGFAWFNDKLWVNSNSTIFIKELEDMWTPLTNIQNLECTLDGHLVGRVDGSFQRSSDGGVNWTMLQSTDFDPPTFVLGTFVGAGYMMYSIDPNYLAYFSENRGMSWKHSDHKFYHIDYSQKYVGAKSNGRLLLSGDGVAWEDVTYDLAFPHHSHYLKSIHYHNGYTYANLYGGEAYRLAEGATIWEHYTNPVQWISQSNENVDILTMESYQNVLFAGVHGYGIFTSIDNGNTWTEENSGLTDKQVLSSAVIGDDIYIGVRGGIWKRPLKEFLAVNTDVIKDLHFSVSPIPSNDFLAITLNDDYHGTAHLTLIDSKGASVNSLKVKENRSIQMDIRDLIPGIYFLHIQAGDHHGMVKVVKN